MKIETFAIAAALFLLFAGAGGLLISTVYLSCAILILASLASILAHRKQGFQRCNRPLLASTILFFSALLFFFVPISYIPDIFISNESELLRSLAQESAAIFSPTDTKNYFSATFNQHGSLRFLLYVIIFFNIVFLTSRIPSKDKKILLHLALAGASFSALCIIISECIYANDGLIWWFIDCRAQTSFGPLVNPNHACTLLNLFLFYSLQLALKSLQKAQNKRSTTYFLTAIILLAGSLLCGSRGGLLTTFTAIAIAFSFNGKRQLKNSVLISICSCLAIFLTINLIPQQLEEEIYTDGFTFENRKEVYTAAPKIISDFPLGIGPGAYRFIAPSYMPRTKASQKIANHSENLYLQLIIELGPFIALILLVIFFLWLKEASHYTKVHSPQIVRWAFGSIFIIFLHGLYDYALEVPLYLATAAIPFGLIMAPLHTRDKREMKNTPHLLSCGIASCIVITIFSQQLLKLRDADRLQYIKEKSFEEKIAQLYSTPTAWYLHYYIFKYYQKESRDFQDINFPKLSMAEKHIKLAGCLNPNRPKLWLDLATVRLKTHGNNTKKPFMRYLQLIPKATMLKQIKSIKKIININQNEIYLMENKIIPFQIEEKHYISEI